MLLQLKMVCTKINTHIFWGKADIESKVYGLSENNIQKVLEEIKKNYTYRYWSCRRFFFYGNNS